MYGDPKVFGKAIGGDITSNKKTFMLINALNRADTETRAELERWTTATEFDPAEKIAAVTEIYNRLGIDELAEQRIKEYFEQSRLHLDELSVSDDRKAVLREYTERMMNRKK